MLLSFKFLQYPDVPKRYKQVVLLMMSPRGNNTEYDLLSSENTCRKNSTLTIQTEELASYLPQRYTACSLKFNAVQQRLCEINSVFAPHPLIRDSPTHCWK